MAKIQTYPLDSTPSFSDMLVGTDVNGPILNATKNFSLQKLYDLFATVPITGTLQTVLNAGNTATQNMFLTGNIQSTTIKPQYIVDENSSTGTLSQILRRTATGIQWVNLAANNLQAVLDAGNTATQNIVLTGNITSTRIIPTAIQDRLGNIGTNGQILSKDGIGVVWSNPPAAPGLDQVLAQGDTSTTRGANVVYIGLYDATNDSFEQITFDNNIFSIKSLANISLSSLSTARTYTLPNKNGTFAMLSDIPIGGGVQSVTGFGVDNADPLNPIVNKFTGVNLTPTGTNAGDAALIASPFTRLINGAALSGALLPTSALIGDKYVITNLTSTNKIIYSTNIVVNGVLTTSVIIPSKSILTFVLSNLGWTVNQEEIIPLTTKGDLYTYNSGITRLPVGLDTQVLIADSTQSTGLKWGSNTAVTPLGYYGAFSDVTNQVAAAINTGYPMRFAVDDIPPNGVSIVANGSGQKTRITFAQTGIYNLQWSAQFVSTDNAECDISVWLRKNGVDVVGSRGLVAVPKKIGLVNGHALPSWNFVLSVTAGEYYEFVWSTANLNVSIEALPATVYAPSTASTILTVTQQAGIMAGTGITALNGLTGAVQTLNVGTTGVDFNISDLGTSHTFNLPTASSINRGALSSSDWILFNSKASGPLYKFASNTPQTSAGSITQISSAIPSNIFSNGDLLKINVAITSGPSTVNPVDMFFYINSTPSIVGATVIGTYQGNAPNRYYPMSRTYWTLDGLFYSRGFNTATLNSESTSNSSISNVSIPSTEFYIIVQAISSGVDRVTIASIQVNKQ